MSYQHLRDSPLIKRLRDGALIPPDPANADYQEVLAWVAAGNTILEADPPPPPTKEQLDTAAARADEKLKALAAATPAQIRAWTNNNFPTLTVAERDKLGTAFVVLCIHARRI